MKEKKKDNNEQMLNNDIQMKDLTILRQEIIESEKSQAGFMKWKIILVASIGAAAFGLYGFIGKGKDSPDPDNYVFLLGLIPLVCAYVDLAYYHLTLRILVIGRFIKGDFSKKHKRPNRYTLHGYELFCKQVRGTGNSFAYESIAVNASSILFSLLVIAYYYYAFFIKTGGDENGLVHLLLIAGLGGLITTFYINWMFKKKHKKINLAYEEIWGKKESET